MSGATHIAASLEDRLNRWLIRTLRRRGWRPRSVVYTGYGSPDFARILGRVLMSRHALPADLTDADAPTPADTPTPPSQRGWRPFAAAPVGMIPVTVTINGHVHHTRADRGGYLDFTIGGHGLEPGWHTITLQARASEPVHGRVLIIADAPGLALLSDIDDTVMVTSVPRPMIALWNTFVRRSSARRRVPGMAELYAQVRGQQGEIPVFYLSTGAWNVVPTITQFLHEQGFPAGPKLMTDWGPTNSGWFRSGREHKEKSLRRLRHEFPNLRWILVGDDGQHDPTIYREFAADHDGAVAAIAIRELSPGEQVLSHGTPTVLEQDAAPSPQVPHAHGKDGTQLAASLLPVLRAL